MVLVDESHSKKDSGQYSKEILQIHKEFKTASEKLLQEANTILQNIGEVNVDKVERLKRLGFRQVQEVIEKDKKIIQKKLTEKQIKLVKYYNEHYPLNNFITEDQVKHICEKYKLVFTNISRYKGFVPEKNLREIENFKLKDNEKNSITVDAIMYGLRKPTVQITLKDFEIKRNAHALEYCHIFKKENNNIYEYAFQSDNGIDFYGSDSKNLFGLAHFGNLRFKLEKQSLKICAPIKDIDTTGLELSEGYKLINKPIKNPVVLQPVHGGYLLLTAWGDEASDPILVNALNN